MDRVKALIRDVPDFPKPGILFKDITPMLQDHVAFGQVIDAFAEMYAGAQVQAVVGMESRGFIFGAPLALKMGVPFVPVRKAGKLPADTEKVSYALEYGTKHGIREVHERGRISICTCFQTSCMTSQAKYRRGDLYFLRCHA